MHVFVVISLKNTRDIFKWGEFNTHLLSINWFRSINKTVKPYALPADCLLSIFTFAEGWAGDSFYLISGAFGLVCCLVW